MSKVALSCPSLLFYIPWPQLAFPIVSAADRAVPFSEAVNFTMKVDRVVLFGNPAPLTGLDPCGDHGAFRRGPDSRI